MSTKSQHIYSVNSTGGGSGGGVTTNSNTNASGGNIIVNETVVVHHHHQTPLDLTCPETMSTTSGDDDDRLTIRPSCLRLQPNHSTASTSKQQLPLHKPTASKVGVTAASATLALSSPKVINLPHGYRLPTDRPSVPQSAACASPFIHHDSNHVGSKSSYSPFSMRTGGPIGGNVVDKSSTVFKPSFSAFSPAASSGIAIGTGSSNFATTASISPHAANAVAAAAAAAAAASLFRYQSYMSPSLIRPVGNNPSATLKGYTATSPCAIVEPPTPMGIPIGAKSPITNATPVTPTTNAPGNTTPGNSNGGGQTTPGPSPRPSILRKKNRDHTSTIIQLTYNHLSISAPTSVIRKLQLDNAVISRSTSAAPTMITNTTTTGNNSNGASLSSMQRNDSPSEETASNHSTVSTSSTVSTNFGIDANISLSGHQNRGGGASSVDSPRKRLRKQQFDRTLIGNAADHIKIEEVDDDGGTASSSCVLGGSNRRLSSNSMCISDEHFNNVSSGRLSNIPLWQVAPPGLADVHKNATPSKNYSTNFNGPIKAPHISDISDADDDDDDDDNDEMVSDSDRASMTPPIRTVSSNEKLSKYSELYPEPKEPPDGPIYRPRPRLANDYLLSWNPRRNHFRRHDGIRNGGTNVRGAAALVALSELNCSRPSTQSSSSSYDERSRLLTDETLARRMSPWKLALIADQLVDIGRIEEENDERLNRWLRHFDAIAFGAQSTTTTNIDDDAPATSSSSSPFDFSDPHRLAQLIREMTATTLCRHSTLVNLGIEGRSSIRQLTRHGTRIDKYLKRLATRRTMRTTTRSNGASSSSSRSTNNSAAAGKYLDII